MTRLENGLKKGFLPFAYSGISMGSVTALTDGPVGGKLFKLIFFNIKAVMPGISVDLEGAKYF